MSFHDMMNPNGGVNMRRVMEPSEPDERLLERILSRENMQSAWKQVRANKGAHGVDKMSVDGFSVFAREHWENIRAAIFDGVYQPEGTRSSICQRTVGEHPLLPPERDPVTSVNRPVRFRIPGGVGVGGEKPPATRLFA